MKAKPARLTKREIEIELRKHNWRRNSRSNSWRSPYHKTILQRITLREAAGIEGLLSSENL